MSDPKHLPSWEQYGYHAMTEMDRFSAILEKMDGKIDRIEEAQAEAKGSARMLGSVYGFATVAIIEAAKMMFGWISKPHP